MFGSLVEIFCFSIDLISYVSFGIEVQILYLNKKLFRPIILLMTKLRPYEHLHFIFNSSHEPKVQIRTYYCRFMSFFLGVEFLNAPPRE